MEREILWAHQHYSDDTLQTNQDKKSELVNLLEKRVEP